MMTCVWCGKRGKKIRYARVRWEKLDSTWYRCSGCDSLMILPRPSKKLLKEVYENDYLHKRLQPHVGVDSRIRYAPDYRPTVYAEYALSLTDAGINRQGIRSVLDFGCADGVFLEFARKYFNTDTALYGTDVSEDLLAQARKKGWQVLPVRMLGTLEKKFDLITLWDVIEHTEDPGTVIRSLKKLLTPGGRMVIQTPRFGVLASLFGENWPHLLPVQHLSLASKEGMQIFAKRMGLTIERHSSFGAVAPGNKIPQPYKQAYDQLAKKLDFGDVQVLSLKHKKR